MNKDILWVERYRPSTIEDLILPENIKSTFREIISQDKIPNLILSESAGTGKTSAAMVLCKSLNCDYIIINGSDEGRLIETLRNNLHNTVVLYPCLVVGKLSSLMRLTT